MREHLEFIFKHFGYKKQLKKLNEECYELIEAVNDYEEQKRVYDVNNPDLYCDIEAKHIAEEIVDVTILIKEIMYTYGITENDLMYIEKEKIYRTLERIENGYYEKEGNK